MRFAMASKAVEILQAQSRRNIARATHTSGNILFRPQIIGLCALSLIAVVGVSVVVGSMLGGKDTDEGLQPEVTEVSTEKTDSLGLPLTDEILHPASGEQISRNLSLLESGDRFLVGGNFAGAYQQFNRLAQSSGVVDEKVLIRLGISAERAGFADTARSHYVTAINSISSSSTHRIKALLGTARVWEQQGKYADAIRLLSDLYLVYAFDPKSKQLGKSIFRQLANCLQKRILDENKSEHHEGTGDLEFWWPQASIEEIISDEALASPVRWSPEDATLQVIQNPGDLSLVLINAKLSDFTIMKLVRRLESSIGHCSKAIVSVIDLPHIASRVAVAKPWSSHRGGYSPFY